MKILENKEGGNKRIQIKKTNAIKDGGNAKNDKINSKVCQQTRR